MLFSSQSLPFGWQNANRFMEHAAKLVSKREIIHSCFFPYVPLGSTGEKARCVHNACSYKMKTLRHWAFSAKADGNAQCLFSLTAWLRRHTSLLEWMFCMVMTFQNWPTSIGSLQELRQWGTWVQTPRYKFCFCNLLLMWIEVNYLISLSFRKIICKAHTLKFFS